jgi:hypothetical protein
MNRCVQCTEDLTPAGDFWVCQNPSCPNFGLLQVGVENDIPVKDEGEE